MNHCTAEMCLLPLGGAVEQSQARVTLVESVEKTNARVTLIKSVGQSQSGVISSVESGVNHKKGGRQ